MADTEFIPVIDLGPYLAGTPGAIDRTAGELRFALTEIYDVPGCLDSFRGRIS